MAVTTFGIAHVLCTKEMDEFISPSLPFVPSTAWVSPAPGQQWLHHLAESHSSSLCPKAGKALLLVPSAFIAVFSFFNFTTIGDGNQYIRKMCSAFRPSEDASYQVRVENRKKMKGLMDEKPIGYGIGLSKGAQYGPKEVMPYPPDSWLVAIWVETGIVGLMLYLLIHGVLSLGVRGC